MKWPLIIVDTKSGEEIKFNDLDELSIFLGKKAIEKSDGTIEVTNEAYYQAPLFGNLSGKFRVRRVL